jgi:hypothetical protein
VVCVILLIRERDWSATDFRCRVPRPLRKLSVVSPVCSRLHPSKQLTTLRNMTSTLQTSSRRIRIPPLRHTTVHCHQTRHASLIRRPKRPYTFTQLVTLSDGSSFMHRTTSPQPLLKAVKDIRNSPLWNPTNADLMNLEQDEAGKLAAFRAKFGRGWDSVAASPPVEKKTVRRPDGWNQAGQVANICSHRGNRNKTPPILCLISYPARLPGNWREPMLATGYL